MFGPTFEMDYKCFYLLVVRDTKEKGYPSKRSGWKEVRVE